ncbi:hypothetical protein LCGC14_0560160 [marine sediment metagenome]|uniref:Uncharacterized protein n=1 Tax=marine sediment metagenome TaxID=412755 RepID=A0A0F9RSD3_9ZZZZ
MKRLSIEFYIKVRDFKFSDEFILKGTFKLKQEWTKVQFQHFIDILGYRLISPNERKVKFHFRLVMRPDMGEISFEGECILESPEQNKISFIIQNTPQSLRKFLDNFILRNCYYHTEKFAKQEKIYFPPAKEILKRLGIK